MLLSSFFRKTPYYVAIRRSYDVFLCEQLRVSFFSFGLSSCRSASKALRKLSKLDALFRGSQLCLRLNLIQLKLSHRAFLRFPKLARRTLCRLCSAGCRMQSVVLVWSLSVQNRCRRVLSECYLICSLFAIGKYSQVYSVGNIQ